MELAELSQDPDFRAVLRSVAEQLAADRAAHGPGLRRDAAAVVRKHAGPVLAAGDERPGGAGRRFVRPAAQG
ncbi:hypothetical protein Misp01_62090 [Microtetraspora sp. NBRC 13810]|nr:hypothetical protein Misp01_62090 [Microtetraspora sp. NBRC 13810]